MPEWVVQQERFATKLGASSILRLDGAAFATAAPAGRTSHRMCRLVGDYDSGIYRQSVAGLSRGPIEAVWINGDRLCSIVEAAGNRILYTGTGRGVQLATGDCVGILARSETIDICGASIRGGFALRDVLGGILIDDQIGKQPKRIRVVETPITG